MSRNRQAFLLLFLLIAAGIGLRPLAAQLTPAGPETRVDTLPGDLTPACPHLGVAPDGSFEIAWDYRQSMPPEVRARHYGAAGSPTDSTEVQVAAVDFYAKAVGVSPVSTGFRILMLMIPDGRESLQFFRRRIDPDGLPAGTPRPVGTAATRWLSPGSGDTLFAGTYNRHHLSIQKVDSLGRPTGKSIILNSRPLEDVRSTPILAPLPDGRWIAVFTGFTVPRPRSPYIQVIRARLFNAKGPEGPDFDVNTTPLGPPSSFPFLNLYDVVVASSPKGFAVSWSVREVTGTNLRVRFYNTKGIAAGDEVNFASDNFDIVPLSGAFDNAGRLLLLWGAGTGLNPDFRLQLFDSSGAPAGPSFRPDSAASGAFNKPVCGNVSPVGDSWLITWMALTENYQPSAIFVRWFQ
jgi:hypothetical protein